MAYQVDPWTLQGRQWWILWDVEVLPLPLYWWKHHHPLPSQRASYRHYTNLGRLSNTSGSWQPKKLTLLEATIGRKDFPSRQSSEPETPGNSSTDHPAHLPHWLQRWHPQCRKPSPQRLRPKHPLGRCYLGVSGQWETPHSPYLPHSYQDGLCIYPS